MGMMKTSQAETAYKNLVARLRALRAAGDLRIERMRLRVKWDMGRAIDRYILKYEKRAPIGKVLLVKLAKDLGQNKTDLYYSLEFTRAYPVFPPVGKLGWAHFRILLSINDTAVRQRITELAAEENWSKRTLLEKIRALGIEEKREQILACLIPKRGKPGIYRIFEAVGKRYYDFGFRIYYETRAKVNSVPDKDLYTYRAEVRQVIDADTIWVTIHLGFKCVTYQKLRLRGIDAPELNTQEGQAAKRALQAMLSKSDVLVTTSKSEKDKYDRYLADVYAGSVYVNQALLDAGHAILFSETALGN